MFFFRNLKGIAHSIIIYSSACRQKVRRRTFLKLHNKILLKHFPKQLNWSWEVKTNWDYIRTFGRAFPFSCDLRPRHHLKLYPRFSLVCSLHSIYTVSHRKISLARCQLSVTYSFQTGVREQQAVRRFLPPTICLLLFISCVCVLQRAAHALRPIYVCRGSVGEEVTC